MKNFEKVVYDSDLHDYLTGHLIVSMKLNELKNNQDECDNVIKNIIINYYCWIYKKEVKDNYDMLSNHYDSLVNIYNYEIIDNKEKDFRKTEKYQQLLKEDREEEEYQDDNRMHYSGFFNRYKDIQYIVEYYKKIFEDEESIIYNIDSNEDDDLTLYDDDEEYYDYEDITYEDDIYEEDDDEYDY